MKKYLVLLLLVCLAPFARGQATSVTIIPRPFTPINVYPDSPLSEATGQRIAAASGGSLTPVTVTTTDVTTSGTVTAGSRGITFIFRAGFTGTVNGVAWAATADASYTPIIPPGTTGPAFTYAVTAGTLRISDSR